MNDELPYPGLRAFNRDETYIFFGREEQTDELLRRLGSNRFLAIVGLSGCGKSSLVRAGLLAALETGFMAQAGPRWRFAVMRPGGRPMQRLASALIAQAGLTAEGINPHDAVGFLVATLRRGPLGLVEALNEVPLPGATSLLIVVDQFEEIFRFRCEGDSDEADAFVALLLASAQQREFPIYVAITMRSDFFGDCAVFSGLPEAINESQFLTPRLTRGQREAAIVGPARVFDGDVMPALVTRLLNESGNDPDQLPLLQHLLMRMWTSSPADHSTEGGSPDAADDRSMSRVLTLSDYERVGGLKDALSRHADEAFASLDALHQRIAEVMFRRLSERGADRRDIRRPTLAGEIAALADVDLAEVIKVVDVFRAPGRSFLTPPGPESISSETILDICHESLIRQWSRLREWSEQEAQSAETYQFLEQSARRWRKGEAALWGNPDLESALAWRERERPTATWARRYGGDFEQAMAFLRSSELKQQEDEQRRQAEATEKEVARSRQVRRLRLAVAGAVGFSIALLSIALSLYYLYFRDYSSYYNTFVTRWGVPHGYGRLTDAQVRQRPSSLQIVSEGRWGHVIRMIAVDSYGRCQPENSVPRPFDLGSGENPLADQKNLQRECRWEFVRDANEHWLIAEKAYDQNGGLVWALTYAPSTDPHSRQAYFVGPDGSLQVLRNPSLQSIEFDYSTNGSEISRKYWSYFGGRRHPEPGRNHAYGVSSEHDANGLVIRFASLDRDDRTLMDDTDGNAILNSTHDELGNVVEHTALDKSGRPTLTKDGWYREDRRYDENGNLISERYFGLEGQPVVLKDAGYHEIRMRYEDGHSVEEAYFDVDGKAANDARTFVHRIVTKYKDGRAFETRFYDEKGNATVSAAGQHSAQLGYDKDGNIASIQYFDLSGRPVVNVLGVHRQEWKYDRSGNAIVESFFDTEGHPSYMKSLMLGDGIGNDTAAGDQITYNDHGEAVSIAWVDKMGARLVGASRYSAIRFDYDDRGNRTRVSWVDDRGKPVRLLKVGYAALRRSYDDRGNVTREELLDEDGLLTLGNDGYAAVERTYDDRNRVVAEAYFGTDDKPILNSGRRAVVKKKYDLRDNVVEESYFDVNQNPITGSYAILRHRYDDHDRMIEEAYFDGKGSRVTSADGYAILRRRVVDDGHTYILSYFDTTEHQTKDDEGCWHKRRKETLSGNLLEITCLAQTLQPAQTETGIAGFRSEYDPRGNVTDQVFVDAKGAIVRLPKAYARLHQTYDAHDRLTEQAFYDADGKPLVQPNGCARIHNRYSDGQLIEQACYGADGKFAVQSNGYAIVRNQYDGSKLIQQAYYGADGNLLAQQDGHAIMRQKFDDHGYLVEQAYYGADGNLRAQPDGYSTTRWKYDDQRNLVEIAYQGENGQPIVAIYGFASMRMQYDEQGNRTVEAYFDQNGKPACLDALYASYCSRGYRYNSSGQEESVVYEDIDRRPVVTTSYSYDTQGARVGVSHRGREGQDLAYQELVRWVDPGSQAEHLLHPGDVLLRYAGVAIDSPDTLRSLTRDTSGDTRDVQILRAGKIVDVQAKPGPLGFADQVTFSGHL